MTYSINVFHFIHLLFHCFQPNKHLLNYGFNESIWCLIDTDDEKEPEIQIGNPTDVKHVAHIGCDGPSTPAPSWVSMPHYGITQFLCSFFFLFCLCFHVIVWRSSYYRWTSFKVVPILNPVTKTLDQKVKIRKFVNFLFNVMCL